MRHVDDQQRPRVIHLFAGAGGGILGGELLGWQTVCAVEIDRFCRDLLVARQNDGCLGPFPIWDDVRTFDGRPWRGLCDIIAGGFPCQDISPLGSRAGINGARSGLWREFARIAGEARPRWIFAENSQNLVRLGLDSVLQDLDAIGYDAEWTCLSAAELGAPHIRDRIWILGHVREDAAGGGTTQSVRGDRRPDRTDVHQPAEEDVRVLADAYLQRREKQGLRIPAEAYIHTAELPGPDVNGCRDGRVHVPSWEWPAEPGVGRVADGVPCHVEQLRGYGNAQVPVVAARAFCDLAARFAKM